MVEWLWQPWCRQYGEVHPPRWEKRWKACWFQLRSSGIAIIWWDSERQKDWELLQQKRERKHYPTWWRRRLCRNLVFTWEYRIQRDRAIRGSQQLFPEIWQMIFNRTWGEKGSHQHIWSECGNDSTLFASYTYTRWLEAVAHAEYGSIHDWQKQGAVAEKVKRKRQWELWDGSHTQKRNISSKHINKTYQQNINSKPLSLLSNQITLSSMANRIAPLQFGTVYFFPTMHLINSLFQGLFQGLF